MLGFLRPAPASLYLKSVSGCRSMLDLKAEEVGNAWKFSPLGIVKSEREIRIRGKITQLPHSLELE